VVETPRGNLVAGMKWFLGAYTGRFHRRHKLVGHLFSGRYQALVVEGSGSGYLKTVCDYVHLNPVRTKLIAGPAALRGYGWSSWPEYLKRPGQRWPWLRVDRLLGEYRIPKDSVAGRRELEAALEERRVAETGTDYQRVRRGWCLESESFRKELLGQMKERLGAEHYGEGRKRWRNTRKGSWWRNGSGANGMKRNWAAGQGRWAEGGDRGAIAGGNGDDGEVDCATAANGRAWPC